MKKTILTSVFAICASVASAQIAIVDTQYVFENSNMTKQVKDEILKITKATKEKIQKQEDSLAKKQEELQVKKSIMNKDLYSQKEEELRQDIIAFRKALKQTQKDLNNQNKEKKQKIAEKIAQAVEKIAKEKKIEAVIAKTFVMYNVDSIEITKEVLEEVNK